MFKLPPSLQMIIFLIVGWTIGAASGYKYAVAIDISKQATNDLEVIVEDQKAEKIITKETNIILKSIREENEEDKPFDCSNAVLPDDRMQRLQREIDAAGRRSDEGLFDRTIIGIREL